MQHNARKRTPKQVPRGAVLGHEQPFATEDECHNPDQKLEEEEV
jgi:hypothetical protein